MDFTKQDIVYTVYSLSYTNTYHFMDVPIIFGITIVFLPLGETPYIKRTAVLVENFERTPNRDSRDHFKVVGLKNLANTK